MSLKARQLAGALPVRRTLGVAFSLLLADGGQAQPALIDAARSARAIATPAVQPAEHRFEVNEYLVRGNSVLDALTIEEAVEPYLGENRSLKDVYKARDALQKIYQDKGYQSVVVQVPPQQVKSGVILLEVTENRIGRMRVEGAKYHSPQQIREAVPALAEGSVPNFNEAQKELVKLNRQPGRQIIPKITPGKMPKTMDVDLSVDDKSPWHASAEVNNDHSADTPSLRTIGNISYDNLWQLGHTLSFTYIVAPKDRSSAEVYAMSYLAPIGDQWNLMLSGYKSNSNVNTVGGTNVLGKGYDFSLQLTRFLPIVGRYGQSVSLGISKKHFDQNFTIGNQYLPSPVNYVPFTLTYTGQWAGDVSSLLFDISGNFGLRGLGSGNDKFDNQRYSAREDFVYLHTDVTFQHKFPHDLILVARSSGQLTDVPLLTSEQFAAGGNTSVRGYLAAEDTADNGALGSLEFRGPSLSPWLGATRFLDEWRFHIFLDGAYMRILNRLPDQQSSFSLLSTGVGTRFSLLGGVDGIVEYAYPIKHGVRTRAHSNSVLFRLKAGI